MPKQLSGGFRRHPGPIEPVTARSTRRSGRDCIDPPILHLLPAANTRDIRLWAIDRLARSVSARR